MAGEGEEHSAAVRKHCAQGTKCLLGSGDPGHEEDALKAGSEERRTELGWASSCSLMGLHCQGHAYGTAAQYTSHILFLDGVESRYAFFLKLCIGMGAI